MSGTKKYPQLNPLRDVESKKQDLADSILVLSTGLTVFVVLASFREER